MSDIARCLQQIEKVKRVAAGVEVAYVARSRLGRLILTATRLVCGVAGIAPPDRPGPMLEPNRLNEELQFLVIACNRLNETAKTITQPSEPLDERWRSGWSTLLSDMAEVEQCLLAMSEVPPTKC